MFMYLHVMKHSVRNVTYNIMFMLLTTFYLKSKFWLKCKCPNECVGYVVYALHLFHTYVGFLDVPLVEHSPVWNNGCSRP